MQSYNGSSFNPNHPAKSINKMIVDGTQGTQYGPGLVQLLNDANGTPKMSGGNLWKALREYNSGSVDSSNLSNGEGATDAYVSNIVCVLPIFFHLSLSPRDLFYACVYRRIDTDHSRRTSS